MGAETSQRGTGGATGAGGAFVSRPTGAGGSAGRSGGGGGTGGESGLPADAGALTCDELAALYIAAVEEDKSCDPSSTAPQCQLRVIPALCAVCPNTTYVNVRTASTAARLRWDDVRCPVPTNCDTECRPLPTSARCMPTGTGAGRCADIIP